MYVRYIVTYIGLYIQVRVIIILNYLSYIYKQIFIKCAIIFKFFFKIISTFGQHHTR